MDIVTDLAHAWLDTFSNVYSMYGHVAMMRFPFAYYICLGAFIINGAVNACASQGDKRLYWYHSLILSIFTSFFGGCISCMICMKPPIILTNELIIPGCILSWYLVQQLGCMQLFNRLTVKTVWIFFATIFRAHGVMNAVDMAAKALPSTSYPGVPLIGPIIVGIVMGTMGMFFPLDKGLSPISKGMPWALQAAILNAFFYHTLVNDQEGFVGTIVRGVLGTHSREAVRVVLVTYYVLSVQAQLWFNAETNFLTPVHKLLYLVFQVPGPGPETKQGFWDHKTKAILESWFEFLRILAALTVFFASIALSTPPTTLSAGSSRSLGNVIGVCQLQQLTPFSGNCAPYHMQMSTKNSQLSLKVYKGQCSSRVVETNEVIWSTNIGKASYSDSPYLSLGEDGALRAFATSGSDTSKDTSVIKEIWKSSAYCKTKDNKIGNDNGKSPVLKLDRSTGVPMIHCADGSVSQLK